MTKIVKMAKFSNLLSLPLKKGEGEKKIHKKTRVQDLK